MLVGIALRLRLQPHRPRHRCFVRLYLGGAAILWKTTRFEERWAKVLTADAEPLRR
jgi:hypothetical protein